MSIATMEALTDLPVGTTVNINRIAWSVAEDNRVTNGTDSIPMHLLEGQIAEGVVTTGVTYEPGQWWQQTSGYTFYVIDARSFEWSGYNDRAVLVYAYFQNDGTYVGIQHSRIDSGTDLGARLPGAPEGVDQRMLTALSQQYIEGREQAHRLASHHECQRTIDSLRVSADSAQESLRRISQSFEALKQSLSDWAIEDESGDIPHNLRFIFDEYDIKSRGTETITVTVHIDGTTEVDLETMHSNRYVTELIQPDASDVEWESSHESVLNLTWTASFSREVEVEDGNCGCESIDRDEVREWLDERGVSYDSFEYETDCDNH